MHITITGDLGSGKTTVAKKLCNILNYTYFSTGKIQREIAAQRKTNTLNLNYIAENDSSIDEYIDNQLILLNNDTTNHIIDSRLAWHFVKNSFKIYIQVDPLVAASRVQNDQIRTNENIEKDIQLEANQLLQRKNLEDNRFLHKYGVHCGDMQNYDFVIDSSTLSIDQVINLIEKKFYEHTLKIISYSPHLKQHFIDLNKAWITTYFEIESHDIEQLDYHKENIIDKGGQIYFAQIDDKIVGTVALINAGNNVFELAKMAVLPAFQGRNIGKKLAVHLINESQKLHCKKLYLISQTSLVPAINLYKKLGFVEVPLESNLYKRANFKAEMYF